MLQTRWPAAHGFWQGNLGGRATAHASRAARRQIRFHLGAGSLNLAPAVGEKD